MSNKLKTYFKDKPFFRNVSYLAGGAALGQLISISISPILTRLYNPDSFGILALYISVVTILSISASLRYELAIPMTDNDDDVVGLILLSLIILCIITFLLVLLIVLFGHPIVISLDLEKVKPYLWFIPIGTFAIGLYQIFNYVGLRFKLFESLAQTRLYQGFTQAFVQIIWGIAFGNHPTGLIIGQVIGQSAGTLTLFQKGYARLSASLRPMNPVILKTIGKRYVRFPKFSALSALINNAGLQLPSLILVVLYGPQIAGLYALGERLTRLPLNLIGQSIGQVYLSEASTRAKESIISLQNLFHQTSKRLMIFCLPVGLLLVFTTPLYPYIFGREWSIAGFYVLALVPMLLSRFIVTPLSQTLTILERQDLQLGWDVFRLALTLISFYIPYLLSWTAFHAIIVYSILMAIANIILYKLSSSTIKNRLLS